MSLEQSQPRRFAEARLHHQVYNLLSSEQQQKRTKIGEDTGQFQLKKKIDKQVDLAETLTLAPSQQKQLALLREKAKAHQKAARSTLQEYMAKESALIRAD